MKHNKIFTKTNLLVLISLSIIVIFGALLRFWHLDTAPKGALIDELHFGYLAYSLIHTGKDEHSQSWPIIFEGFGDQKLPAMAYLDIPTIAIFGLSILAFRIPSALAGSVLILVSYWLLWEITQRKKWGLFAALITAISPWSFFLSRFGFESNLALTSMSLGFASLFTAERTKRKVWYVFSAFGFAFSWYSYIAYRPITAVILLAFALIKITNHFNTINFVQIKTSLKQNKKTLIIFFLSFALLVAPLFGPSSIGVNNTRFDQVGITTDSGTEIIINEKRNFCDSQLPRLLCDIAWNKPTFFFKELTHRYLLAFSPEFLVTKGELSTDFLTIDSFGQFFPVLYPLFFLGLAGFIFVKNSAITKTQKWLVVLGLLVSPLPSAFVGEPQKVRISALFPFMLITIVYGTMVLEKLLNTKMLRSLFMIALITTLLGYTFLYQMEYHGVHTIQNEYKYQSYLPGLNKYLETLPKEAIINIKPFYSDPLMFYAFYTKMDPALYQSLAILDEYDGANFRHTIELGNVWAHKYSPEKLSCISLERGVRAFYVTDKKIEYLELVHHEQSTNGVNTYLYVYEVTKLMLERNCEEYTN